jgi:hypothetical protein
MARMMMENHQSRRRGRGERPRSEGLLRAPRREGEVRGNYPGHVMRSSAYTEVASRPWLARAFFLAGVYWLGQYAFSEGRRIAG